MTSCLLFRKTVCVIVLHRTEYCLSLHALLCSACLGPPPADMTGLIVGVVFGILGAIVIILLIVGGVIWFCQSSSRGKL